MTRNNRRTDSEIRRRTDSEHRRRTDSELKRRTDSAFPNLWNEILVISEDISLMGTLFYTNNILIGN